MGFQIIMDFFVVFVDRLRLVDLDLVMIFLVEYFKLVDSYRFISDLCIVL